MRSLVFKIVPWIITAVAIYFAFHNIEWSELVRYLKSANIWWLLVATGVTCCSYLFRGRRWQGLFPHPTISFFDSTRVLILGFFMNNILPARTGELVRAHMGGKATGETRTLVLATILSERLADGLAISFMFVIFFAFHLDASKDLVNLFYVACLFAVVGVGVVLTLAFRNALFRLIELITKKLNSKLSGYTENRIKVFINALSPLCTPSKLPFIILWSTLIWLTELMVYVCVVRSFDAPLTLPLCVLFLVVVNFSSLIPAAPGGIGVIEAVATAVLVSVGVDKELALPMVLAQHAIQILVVGIPGAAIMATWKRQIQSMSHE